MDLGFYSIINNKSIVVREEVKYVGVARTSEVPFAGNRRHASDVMSRDKQEVRLPRVPSGDEQRDQRDIAVAEGESDSCGRVQPVGAQERETEKVNVFAQLFDERKRLFGKQLFDLIMKERRACDAQASAAIQ